MAYNVLANISAPQFRPSGFDLGNYLSIFTIYEDGSIALPGGSGTSDTPVSQFIGYEAEDRIGGGLPHGPLFIQRWELTAAYTGESYGDGTDDGWSYWVQLVNQSLAGPLQTACTPVIVTDSISGQPYVSLLVYAPIYDLVLSGPPLNSYYVGSVVSWATPGLPSGGVGLWNLGLSNGSIASYAKFAQNYFPAFDMSDTWYETLTYVDSANPANNHTSGECGSPSGGFPSSEYAPMPGYTLTSQSSTGRVWSRPNASGGTDTITITLSGLVDLASELGLSAVSPSLYFDLGQVFISGRQTGGVLSGPGIQTQTLDEDGDIITTTTYIDNNFQAWLLNSDGSTELLDMTVPGGDSSDPAAGTLTLSTPGQIVLSVGGFDQPETLVAADQYNFVVQI